MIPVQPSLKSNCLFAPLDNAVLNFRLHSFSPKLPSQLQYRTAHRKSPSATGATVAGLVAETAEQGRAISSLSADIIGQPTDSGELQRTLASVKKKIEAPPKSFYLLLLFSSVRFFSVASQILHLLFRYFLFILYRYNLFAQRPFFNSCILHLKTENSQSKWLLFPDLYMALRSLLARS